MKQSYNKQGLSPYVRIAISLGTGLCVVLLLTGLEALLIQNETISVQTGKILALINCFISTLCCVISAGKIKEKEDLQIHAISFGCYMLITLSIPVLFMNGIEKGYWTNLILEIAGCAAGIFLCSKPEKNKFHKRTYR